MADIRIVRMAEILVTYSAFIRRGETVAIVGSVLAQPLIKEMVRLATRVRALVDVYGELPEIRSTWLKGAAKEQLLWQSIRTNAMFGKYDKVIVIESDQNTRELAEVPGKSMRYWLKARRKVLDGLLRRTAGGRASWCITLFPTPALAQEAGMSLERYEDFVFGACFCNSSNGLKRWKELAGRQARLVTRLNKVGEVRIKSADTDLVARVAGRRWESCDGKLNFPDGEVFTGPVEKSVNGHIRFTYPAIYLGKEVADIFLEFKNGRVVKAEAAKGEDLLREIIKADKGASFVGELAIATNYGIDKFTKNILFDEKIGGTVHLALGRGYPETGSKNRSSIHWDMICDMRKGGRIYADGTPIYSNGRFK